MLALDFPDRDGVNDEYRRRKIALDSTRGDPATYVVYALSAVHICTYQLRQQFEANERPTMDSRAKSDMPMTRMQ